MFSLPGLQETNKAQKAYEKAGKEKIKASKILNKAEQGFQDASAKREKAEKSLVVRCQ